MDLSWRNRYEKNPGITLAGAPKMLDCNMKTDPDPHLEKASTKRPYKQRVRASK
jgi:hypothetical protein